MLGEGMGHEPFQVPTQLLKAKGTGY